MICLFAKLQEWRFKDEDGVCLFFLFSNIQIHVNFYSLHSTFVAETTAWLWRELRRVSARVINPVCMHD